MVLSQVQHTALDDILRPHLRLEPLRETEKTENVRGERSPGKAVTQPSRGHVLGSHGKVYRIRTGPRHWEAYSWEMSLYLKKKNLILQVERRTSSVLQGTIETDNKMRLGVLRKNSTRFEEPTPIPPDPNSEAKSETIRRMQRNLEEWNEELKAIQQKKAKNGRCLRCAHLP